jgi:hypothetical protein
MFSMQLEMRIYALQLVYFLKSPSRSVLIFAIMTVRSGVESRKCFVQFSSQLRRRKKFLWELTKNLVLF